MRPSAAFADDTPAMYRAAVVPYQHIPGRPLMLPYELRTRNVRPDGIEQAVTLLDRHVDDIAIPLASEKQTFPPRVAMGANRGKPGAR